IARWLQDVAYNDVDDAGVADHAVWVVRRARLQIATFPRFGDRVELATFCSGVGRAWAERRTSIARDGVSAVEAVALWVHLDPATWNPCPLTEREMEVYGGTAGDRRVSARLRHPAPGSGEVERSWSWAFRGSETDIAQHV